MTYESAAPHGVEAADFSFSAQFVRPPLSQRSPVQLISFQVPG